ncbi:hypothetical protein N7457_005509 [Penicillium paradoxum]|uniref:uncharacterized protein n=1 Tax=Penicillium paradoxum TaxID=176176 RepID=UPI0025483327|nr:uncharacterized protein N7457_005509 [Penicillium paradoxum]KAJ5780349.1 hypothetical protein N7457_005509 [Penicillium paradoxum]
MSKYSPRSITSAGSESAGSIQQPSPRTERSASNPASYTGEHYDTALPSMDFHSHAQPSLAHRRTGSTLKTVMRKIFNRKRQSQADELEENPYESSFARPPVRTPGLAKGKSPLAVPPPLHLNSHRSSPLSVQNLQLAETHLSPLSPLSSATLRDSMPGSMQPRRRRATLPSVVFSDDESRFAVASTAISDPQEDKSYLPERRHSLLSHRLSRSADALREMTEQLPEGLASWPAPTSAPAPASIPGSPPPLDESSNSGQSVRPSSGTTVTSVTRMSDTPSLMEDDQRAEQASLPPNFASFINTMQQDDSVTLEQRLTTLEVKLIDLEFAIARMQTNGSEKSNSEKSSRSRHHPSSESFSRPRKTSGLLSPSDREESPSPLNASARPSSTSTIRPDTTNSRTLRPAPSATSLSEYQGVSIEQYSTLVTLLRREQTARRNLETQVGTMRDDIRNLQRVALESMQSNAIQPMPSPQSREFLRFRRAMDDTDSSQLFRSDDQYAGITDSDSEWDRSDLYSRDDPFGHSKWERQRIVTAPMI